MMNLNFSIIHLSFIDYNDQVLIIVKKALLSYIIIYNFDKKFVIIYNADI